MFWTRTEKVDYNFVDLDKVNIDYCRFFNLCRLLVYSWRIHYNRAWTIHSSKCILGRFNSAFSNIVTDKYLKVSYYCKHYSKIQRMRKLEIIILKLLVFVFYVAFCSQLSAIVEALERLLIKRFFTEERAQLSIQTVESLLSYVDEQKYSFVSHEFEIIEDKHQSFKQEIRCGKKGKTAQFWLSYLDMMEQQHYRHVGIQENSFEARMNAWEYFLPFYFVMNKLNYARYGSYYLHQMKNGEVIYPGLKVPISVQGQNRYNIRTPIDQRGEQTLNKQPKTVGGIKGALQQIPMQLPSGH